MKCTLYFLSLIVLASSAAANSVRVVSPSGPYAEIQSAVDIAQDGDVILVKTGTYASFVVRELDLTIVADAGANVQVNGAIRVSGISATQALLISGLKATGAASTNTVARFGLYAKNCPGSLRIQDCVLVGGTGQGHCGLRSDGTSIENCQDVVFTRCTITGAAEYVDWNPGAGLYGSSGFGAVLSSSRVGFYDCMVRGGNGVVNAAFDCQTGYGYSDSSNGGDGCSNSNSFVFGSGTLFQGGSGANADPTCPMGPNCTAAGNGGAGMSGTSGSQLPPQLLTSPPQGGSGGSAAPCGFTCLQPGYQGHAGPGTTHAPPPGVLPGTARVLNVSRVVREQALVTFIFQGTPSESVSLYLSDATRFRFRSGARGVLVPGSGGPQPILQIGTIPPSGTITEPWTIPDLGPGVQARRVILQPAFTSSTGQVTLGTPQAIVLLDQAF